MLGRERSQKSAAEIQTDKTTALNRRTRFAGSDRSLIYAARLPMQTV